MPLNEFKIFIKRLKKENFIIKKNTFTSMILLISVRQNILHPHFFRKIFIKDDNYENDNLKPNIYKSFLVF